MAKRSDKYKELAAGDIDLVPMMNLLSILIPVLLISTEYIKLAVIPVTSPRQKGGGPVECKPGQPDDPCKPPDPPPLNLTIAITSAGLYVKASGQNVEPPEGAPPAGAEENPPTLALVPVTSYYGGVKGREELLYRIWEFKGRHVSGGTKVVSDEEMEKHIAALTEKNGALRKVEEKDYNFPALNELLQKIKTERPDEEKVILTGEPTTRFSTVVTIMDVARFKLDRGKLTDEERASFAADDVNGNVRRKERLQELRAKDTLFPKVIIAAGVG